MIPRSWAVSIFSMKMIEAIEIFTREDMGPVLRTLNESQPSLYVRDTRQNTTEDVAWSMGNPFGNSKDVSLTQSTSVT